MHVNQSLNHPRAFDYKFGIGIKRNLKLNTFSPTVLSSLIVIFIRKAECYTQVLLITELTELPK